MSLSNSWPNRHYDAKQLQGKSVSKDGETNDYILLTKLLICFNQELYYLVDLVQPGVLGDWKNFQKDYSKPITNSR